MVDLVNIPGGRELLAELRALPVKLEVNIARGGLRAAAKVIQRAAQAGAPARSGNLRNSIRVASGRTRSGVVRSAVTVGGGSKTGRSAWYARLVEGGTKAHEIKPKKRKSLFFAGLMREIIRHPGAKAQPFMRPAMQQAASAAVQAYAQYARTRLAKEHTKQLPLA